MASRDAEYFPHAFIHLVCKAEKEIVADSEPDRFFRIKKEDMARCDMSSFGCWLLPAEITVQTILQVQYFRHRYRPHTTAASNRNFPD